MATEKTLGIIKPNATKAHQIGNILARYEQRGLQIVAARYLQLSTSQAELFYEEHKARPFFKSLVSFMTSGPVLVFCLQGPNAIVRNREIMGATDPAKADPGTIRKDFGKGIEENAVHGSDSPASAAREIGFFFSHMDIIA